MNKVWQAKLEIDLNAILFNINQIRKKIGDKTKIMPIIKDNAYGTYINEKQEVLQKAGIEIVGVAIVDEAIALRKKGYTKEIFILNQPFEEDIDSIIEYGLTIGVGSIDFLKKLGMKNKDITIHIEIGTRMGRTGIHPNRVEEYIKEAKKYPNLKIEGIYTHFSSSDTDAEYTKKQIQSFNKAIEIAKKENLNIKYTHCCNSAGIIDFKEAHFNLVRPGIILYGYYPTEEFKNKIQLKPSTKLKSKISFIKQVGKGTSIGYGRSYITEKETKIATIPLGYGDGIRRCLSNRGNVVINGQLAPIIGKICMDCFMVDVTNIKEVEVEDEVYIWDNKKITVEDIAQLYDTINYEVLVSISSRVPRQYIELE